MLLDLIYLLKWDSTNWKWADNFETPAGSSNFNLFSFSWSASAKLNK
jgi:hypothetical protein